MKTMKPKSLLSTLWIVLTVNYIFCDVFTLMYSEELKQLLTGKVGDIEMTQSFLLAFALVMEIPMLMIVLSRILKYKVNRGLNIAAGLFMTFVQASSLFMGDLTLHYIFFSVVEIALSLLIAIFAFRWKNTKTGPNE